MPRSLSENKGFKQHLTEQLTQLAVKTIELHKHNYINKNPNPQHKKQYCFRRPLKLEVLVRYWTTQQDPGKIRRA